MGSALTSSNAANESATAPDDGSSPAMILLAPLDVRHKFRFSSASRSFNFELTSEPISKRNCGWFSYQAIIELGIPPRSEASHPKKCEL